jgi:hypothetical protein
MSAVSAAILASERAKSAEPRQVEGCGWAQHAATASASLASYLPTTLRGTLPSPPRRHPAQWAALVGHIQEKEQTIGMFFHGDKVVSVALTFQTCLDFGGARQEAIAVKPLPAPVISDMWGEVIATTDRDPDDPNYRSIYIFVDPESKLKRDAGESCSETSPKTRVVDDRQEVHIKITNFGDSKDFSVICQEAAKTS